jgi:hypothetical protein
MSQTTCSQLHPVGISDMPKQRKSVHQIQNQFQATIKRLREVEIELSNIQKECPEKTSCYLRYGWMFAKPYEHGGPHDNNVGVDSWQHALADFYTDEANRLLKERDELLKKMYRFASRYYDFSETVTSLSAMYPHLRKPCFRRC